VPTVNMTNLIHPDVPEQPGGVPVVTPIFQTSTYELPRDETGAQIAASVAPAGYYTRYGSPNARECEAMLRDLDGAEAALLVGSGMAAVTVALLANLRAGDHVVAQTTHYTGTLTVLTELLPRYGVQVSMVDQTDTPGLVAAITDRTALVYTETPSNPLLALTDLAEVSAAAHAHGALHVTDNTFATPYNTSPLELGVDLVVQSATKYLNGHSDVTAGVLTGRAELIERAWELARVQGPLCHPFEAWLLARGLRTFPLRMRRHNENAQAVADFLTTAPGVTRVHYPGLDGHPQRDLARRQMRGYGGVLSFEVVGGSAGAAAVLRGTRMLRNAVSLGGPETLITHPGSLVFAHQSDAELDRAGIRPGLLRLAVGLEEPEDIIADLRTALAAVNGDRS
jgi:cystathionine beta-lyase/cystathionine gamma-synthase